MTATAAQPIFSPGPNSPTTDTPANASQNVFTYDTPPVIQKAIDDAGGGFYPDKHRAEYDEYSDLWKLYVDLMELDAKKIECLIVKHAEEDDCKLKLRKQLAACFNLIPSVINMLRDYIFSEEPTIDVNGDVILGEFLNDCDGRGTKFSEFIKHRVLPLSLAHGMVDVLIENPMVDEPIVSELQAKDSGAKPVATTISMLQRINWSVRATGEYNWVCFEAVPIEDPNPFARNRIPVKAYITLSAHNPGSVAGETGFWLRSWKQKMLPDAAQSASQQGAGQTTAWQTIGDFFPTKRVPVASLFFQKSLDHTRPHWPVSKIGMMAVLTKLMIQVLSWTEEDILANLAVISIPGPAPKNEDGTARDLKLTPSSILYSNPEAKHGPMVLQGAVDHIRVKMEFVSAIVQEILRLAHLIGVSAEVEKVTSGVQGMVLRNELFQELSTLSGSLDAFTYEILALVKGWATNTDYTKEKLLDEVKPKVAFKKEGFTLEPLKDLIDDAEKLVSMFRRVSPEMVKQVYKIVAREVLYSEDSAMEEVMKEIEDNTEEQIAAEAAAEDITGQLEALRAGDAFNPTAAESQVAQKDQSQ